MNTYHIMAATANGQYPRQSFVADGWDVSQHGLVKFYIEANNVMNRKYIAAYLLDTSEYVTN